MRAKRSKKYRKLMHQYELTFGFREPYQVLGTLICGASMRRHMLIRARTVDSNFLSNVDSFKMDLIPALERTLQGKVKPCECQRPTQDLATTPRISAGNEVLRHRTDNWYSVD